MKKKILFIVSNMNTGGVPKSLTSLLNVIDRKRYDVALMITAPTGELMELLPKDLRLIVNPIWNNLTDRMRGSWQLIKSGHPLLAIGNCIRLCVSFFNKAKAAELIATMMPPLDEEFDTVVDYNGQQQLYYMVNKIKATKKVTFFHSDYEKWSFYYDSDKKYFPQVDYIFTISEKCVSSIKRFFPAIESKVKLMENISSQSFINELALKDAPEISGSSTTLITIGRVCEDKGILWAIDAAKILKEHGIDFKWFFIGPIDKPADYKAYMAAKDIEDEIIFLGVRTNPYPYIRESDIVVHPSKFEGRSIALDEAKLLCKPIVVTNFSTVGDQFTNGHNATICGMNPQSIASSILELITNHERRQIYVENLKAEAHDNTSEIEKLYNIFDD